MVVSDTIIHNVSTWKHTFKLQWKQIYSEREVLLLKAMKPISYFDCSSFCLWVLRNWCETGVNTGFSQQNTSQFFEKERCTTGEKLVKHVFFTLKTPVNFFKRKVQNWRKTCVRRGFHKKNTNQFFEKERCTFGEKLVQHVFSQQKYQSNF